MADDVNETPGGAEDGLLTQEQMIAGLLGTAPIEGDTTDDPSPEVVAPEEQVPETTEPTAAATEPAKPGDEVSNAAGEPVGVLAKDGKSVIPFSVLEQERAKAAHWEAQARALHAERQAAAKQPATEGEATAVPDIAKLVAEQVARELEPIKRREHYGAIEAAHPDVKEIGKDPAFEAWIASHPSFVRDQYTAVREGGSSAQVIEMLSAFKASQPKPAAAPAVAPTKEQLKAAAKTVVAGAKPTAPSSLSELPAGGAQVLDEVQALQTMSPESMRAKFAGMSPKAIEELMSRVL